MRAALLILTEPAAGLGTLAPHSRFAVATRVLDQVEQDLIIQRRQRELQLEQARYEVRLAQRQYDAVDPANRLVAAELERRWNEKLERVSQLERTYTQAECDAEWNLTVEERAAITELSRDLPAIWSAETASNQERKQLLRMAIDSVQLDGIRQAGQIEIQIHWHSGAITNLSVKRSAPGEGSLKTPAEVVSRIQWLHVVPTQRSPHRSIVPVCAARLVGVLPASTSGISVGGTDWQKASQALDYSRKTVRILLVQRKVE